MDGNVAVQKTQKVSMITHLAGDGGLWKQGEACCAGSQGSCIIDVCRMPTMEWWLRPAPLERLSDPKGQAGGEKNREKLIKH